MNCRNLIIGTVALVAAASIASAAEPQVTAKPESEAALKAATNIVFKIQQHKGEKQVSVSAPAQVRSLTSTLTLQRKQPCACEHLEGAVFEGPSGTIQVSFCNHCFDFGGNTYDMPKEFYAQYLKLVPKSE
jgi:hypothetical protein